MQCKKCGFENMAGAQICQKCGVPLEQLERRGTEVPLWFGSRFIGFFTVIAAALVMAGMFLPWAEATPNLGAPSGTLSASASGWDLMTESGQVEEGAEPYAILVFAGAIVLLLGAAWAFLDPQSKNAWATSAAGGLLAIGGCIWALMGIEDCVLVGVNAADFTITEGAGLYMSIGGGVAAAVASVIGRLGTTPERLRL